MYCLDEVDNSQSKWPLRPTLFEIQSCSILTQDTYRATIATTSLMFFTMACRLTSLLLITICVAIVQAATVTYDFNLTWVTTNPDGAYDRPTIGINGQWPLPRIVATVGDRMVVNVHNQLENRTSSLHFHGLYMNGSTQMDGPVGVSQCAIPPGSSFTYDFNVRYQCKAASSILKCSRSHNLAPTGTMHTMKASIRMD